MKKEIFFSSILVCLIVFLVGTIVIAEGSDSGDGEWRMFGRSFSNAKYIDINSSIDLDSVQNITFNLGAAVQTSPVIAGNYLYVASDNDVVYQLNASNISQQVANFTSEGTTIHSQIAVANGYLYVGAQGDFDGYFYQLNASNISQQLSRLFVSFESFVGNMFVSGNSVFALGRSDVYELNATNVSQIIRQKNFGAGQTTGLMKSGTTVFMSGTLGPGLYALSLSDIQTEIAFNNTYTGYSIPSSSSEYVYASTSDGPNSLVVQFLLNNLSYIYAQYDGPSTGFTSYSSPSVANGYIYVGSDDNYLYQLNASNISQHIANYSIANDVRSSGAVTNQYIFIGDDAGNVHQLNASNVSQLIGVFASGSQVREGLVFLNDYLYFSSGNSLMQLLPADATPPVVTINSPTATTYSVDSVSVNISTDETASCTYSVDSGLTNISLTAGVGNTSFTGTLGSLSDGSYRLYAYCADSAGNRNDTQNVQFTISATSDDSWPMFGKDNDFSFYSTITPPFNLSDATADSFSGISAGNYKSPAMANGSVYVMSTLSNLAGTFYQLNNSNISQVLGSYDLTKGSDSTPLVHNGFVYLASGDGILYQFNATNASIKFAEYDLPASNGGTGGASTPVVSGSYLYIYSNNAFDGKMIQLNASNVSQEVATYTLSVTNANEKTVPAVSGGYVYLSLTDGVHQFLASDVSTRVNFNSNLGSVISPAIVSGGSVYVGNSADKVFKLNAGDLSHVQNYSFGCNANPTSISAAKGYVYVGTGASSACSPQFILQLNATNISQVINNFSAGSNVFDHFPAITKDYFFISDNAGKVIYQLNSTNITQYISNYTFADSTVSNVEIYNGSIYVISTSGPALYKLTPTYPDTTPPRVTINFPGNVTYNAGNTSFNFNVSLNEQGSVFYGLTYALTGVEANYTMLNSSAGGVYGMFFNKTNSSLGEGAYLFRAYANDTAGNQNHSMSVSFSYDATSPVISIISPTATTYSVNSYVINVSLNESGSCSYSLNGGTTNTSLTANATNTGFTTSISGASNGAYTLNAYCQDNVGNTASGSVSFSISVSSGDTGDGSNGYGGGGGGGGSPKVNPPVVPKCTAVYLCGDWGQCSEGKSQRTCYDIKCSKLSINQYISCDNKICVPDITCSEWSACANGFSNRVCVDNNACVDSKNDLNEKVACTSLTGNVVGETGSENVGEQQNGEPVSKTCTPKFECKEWSQCKYDSSVEQIFEGNVRKSGYRERGCIDSNGCADSYMEKDGCLTKAELGFEKEEVHGTDTLFITGVDGSSKITVASINIDSWKDGKLEISFLQNRNTYPASCYNGILDNDESGIDCGGSCNVCSSRSKLFGFSVSSLAVYSEE